MELIFDGENSLKESEIISMRKSAAAALEKAGVENKDIEISITFVSREEIKTLNNDFRGIDKFTDVLSFPQFEFAEDIPEGGTVLLGDVVICIEKAEKQAKEFGHSKEREILYLFTHSILHLLGYDHMQDDEKNIMRTLEEEIMETIGVPRV